uniref:Uncharacterized protein n=1 Tax=Parascaris equorum TaxID=6256 RepID=A0A914RGY3_PAREQ
MQNDQVHIRLIVPTRKTATAKSRRVSYEFMLPINADSQKTSHPWSKGRLFIRRRDCVLAAIQRGNEAVV